MPFPSRMSDGEHQVLALRPHWLGVVTPLVITVLLLVGLAAALLSIPESWPSWVRWIAVGVFALILVAWPLRRVSSWVTSEYVITNERVMHRQGWLTQRSVEIPILGVADVVFSQTVLQRLVAVGDVMIESAGGLGFTRLAFIPRADDVHRTLYDLIDDARVITSNHSNGPPTPLDQIERLARLRERGLLTTQEFETHKQRLLKQL